ncbi:MAG: HAD family phosphatase [Tannerellaceae bacterium]|jgi:putative hydrolase of the HAD superfamily|nr:HAD family phosphatase [Tannerellaceae bacterium]
MDNIKNLIIDFGGVIINLTRNRCIDAFAHLGMDVREQLGATVSSCRKNLFMQLEKGELSPADFRDDIREYSNRTLSDKEIDDAWIAMLGDVPEYKLDLLLQLKKEYNTMLLSNTNSIHWEWAKQNVFTREGHTVGDFFHRIYLSYELNMEKPDREIFDHVLNDARILPEETLFIDDAPVNCKAAEALGIRTYTPEPREDWSFLFRK